MNSPRRKTAHDRGFTILEVLVALTILAISITTLFSIFSDTLLQTDANRNRSLAGLHAKAVLAQLGAEFDAGKENTGDFGDGFRWTISGEQFGTTAERDAWPYAAQRLQVKVTWQESGREKSLQLVSLRLLPRKASP